MFERASDAVKITLIVSGALVLLAVIGSLVWLVDRGRDVTAIMTLVTTLLVPLGGALLWGKLATVERQTNGNAHRLLTMVERSVPTATAPAAPVTDLGEADAGTASVPRVL